MLKIITVQTTVAPAADADPEFVRSFPATTATQAYATRLSLTEAFDVLTQQIAFQHATSPNLERVYRVLTVTTIDDDYVGREDNDGFNAGPVMIEHLPKTLSEFQADS